MWEAFSTSSSAHRHWRRGLRGGCGASRQDGPIEVVGLCKGSKVCPADTMVIKKDLGGTENRALESKASRCRTGSLQTASQTDNPKRNGESYAMW